MRDSPTDVILIPFHGSDVPQSRTSVCRKRATFWENAERNRFIAKLAEPLAQNARRALRRLGVGGKHSRFPKGSPLRVVILTETADHAWALRDFLPNWPVRDGMPEMNDEAAWTLPKPVPGHIATLMYAYRYRIPCDILVRASAGTGSLDWDSAGDVRLLDGKPALILDIADVSHPHDKVDVEVRTKEYAEQGLRRRIIDVPNETH